VEHRVQKFLDIRDKNHKTRASTVAGVNSSQVEKFTLEKRRMTTKNSFVEVEGI
jgi:ABC-type phosphate transport system auxiliary subunit